jgi:hypothetical protein
VGLLLGNDILSFNRAFSLGFVLWLLLGNDNKRVVFSLLFLLLGSGTTVGWHFLWGPFRALWKEGGGLNLAVVKLMTVRVTKLPL